MIETKQCPYCAEEIIATAIKCKHCGAMLVEGKTDKSFTPETFIRASLSSRYELLEEIGRGGMSVVYRALQKNLDRVVALKVLPPQLAHDKDFLDRFHRESRSAARLSHPNIITIFDEGIENGVHFMAMELLEGTDLHQRTKQFGKLNPEEMLPISIQIARALGHAHQNGIVHRDVKSSNIILCRDGRILLTDFGIAHAMQGTQLTMSGTVLGTPEFMSPEQADGKPVDGRSDIYSLGVVMYYGLTGRFPFSGDNPLTTIYKIINDSYTPISSLVKVPIWLELIVNACLEKNVNDRIPNCTRLMELLERKQEIKKPSTFSKVKVEENRTIKLSKEQFGKLNVIEQPKLTSPSAKVVVNSNLFLKIIISLVAITLLVVLMIQLTNNDKDTTQINSHVTDQIKPNTTQSVDEKTNKVNLESNVIQKDEVNPIQKQETVKEKVPDEKMLEIWDFTNNPIGVAEQMIKKNGFRIGLKTIIPSSPENTNMVLRQIPKAGTMMKKGASINLVIGGSNEK